MYDDHSKISPSSFEEERKSEKFTNLICVCLYQLDTENNVAPNEKSKKKTTITVVPVYSNFFLWLTNLNPPKKKLKKLDYYI